MKENRILPSLMSICRPYACAVIAILATSSANADSRGLPGGVFMATQISTWRADLIKNMTKPAPNAGFTCSNVMSWSIGELLPPPQNYLAPHEPDIGGDYGTRPDKKMFYNVGAKANYNTGVKSSAPNAMYVFCWDDKSAAQNPEKASGAYLIPSTSPLTVCEVADRPGSLLICH